MINRIKGVLLLESETFNEIEHDEKATGQAALVVIVASILAALGVASDPFVGALQSGLSPVSFGSGSALVVFLGVIVWSLLAWLVWAFWTYLIGTKIFDGKATYGEMMRVTGYAYAPLAFMILSAIPCIGFAISLIISVWALAAVFVGVREGLDLDFGRALVTVVVGWIIYGIGMGLLVAIFGLF